MLARLFRESTVGVIHVFAHGVMTRTTSESPERDDALVLNDILHVLDGFQQVQPFAGSCCFVRVLKMSSQVINPTFGG